MSTRCLIGKVNYDGTITTVYCHNSGDPASKLPVLTEHYSSPEKVDELLALGNLSILAPEIGFKHSFDLRFSSVEELDKMKPYCLFYGRDRGDKDWKASIVKEKKLPAWAEGCDAEFVYLFNGAEWFAYTVKGKKLITIPKEAKVEEAVTT